MYLHTFQVYGNFEAKGSTADTVTIQTMTVDDLASTYTAAQSLAVLYQRDATGRRCHKTLRGRGEAVWPPNLEAALITGLQVYSERHRVHMRHRGRFIGRNHFLSDYVKSITGRRRSAKQVGSRLQQLKDTCRQLEILYLITGSRSPSPRRDSRRRKSGSKHTLRRSPSTSPELSDVSTEMSPEPEIEASPEYLPCPEISQQETYSTTDATAEPVSPVYDTVPEITYSYPNDQPSTSQYYTHSSQYYSQEWSNTPHSSQQTYQQPSQQWVSYYSHAEPQQQQFVYYDSQYY
ncbi:hypothetical protein P691DRAFT_811215 [Macrolepiota fuliginosa MF-IS2]|uniref:TEA domain-containing protein n=1 Tax=Macrolepiota fuliginosa MF-IS2 TaxID=1400762 RepID=A0A9P5XG53_9AGAR|nr:hypothetical protein P691DRAFT_811215 [Macrolepiota fuliginosa MF-IS2]